MAELPKVDLESKDLVAERIEKMKALFPELFDQETQLLDFDRLRLLLGEDIDESDERYTFTWPGKSEAIRQSQTTSSATLRPIVSRSNNWNETKNLYIEGDNLEVLKLLLRGYYGKVKMIYIDPPYNTGHDFVYRDTFGSSIENYREQAGLSGQSNADTSGSYHSNWCTMMYARLLVARELLTDDGVIFISIDDNESTNLAKMCDEVFPGCFVNRMTWTSNLKGRQIGGSGAAKCAESIYVYSKLPGGAPSFIGDIEQLKTLMPSSYKGLNYSVLTDERGDYVIKNELYNSNSIFNEETRPNLVFDIGWNPETGEVCTVDRGAALPASFIRIEPHKNGDGIHSYHAWRWGREKVEREYYDLHFEQTSKTRARVFTKIRDYSITTLKDVFTDLSTSTGVKDCSTLFGGISYFDYAKPVDLVATLVKACTEADDVIMDFFSGSGTTAEAVMKVNSLDSANRRFILIQLPEPCAPKSRANKDGFETICDIAEERIRRAGQKHANIRSGNQMTLSMDSACMPDVGFRVLALDESGIIKPENGQLLIDRIKPDRTDLDIIFEMMLKWGLELTYPVEEDEIEGYPVYSVAYDELICCMQPGLTTDVLEAIAARNPRRVFLLDSAIDDTIKLNALQIFKRVEERTQQKIDLRTV